MQRIGFLFGLALYVLITHLGNVRASDERAITLDVDATEASRRIYHARMTFPVEPGPLTLYFPKWIPGTHGPTGPIASLAGLKMTAGGKPVEWQRDEEDMYAFHCVIPDGAKTLDVMLDHVTGGRGGSSATTKIAVVRWNEMLLYPKGPRQQDIQLQTSLRLPADWKLGTALPITSQDGGVSRFGKVSLETLIDSPVVCGLHFREIPIGPQGEPRHFLDLACESAEGLKISPELKGKFDRLVVEAGALYGARHYKKYHFLVTLSDKLPLHGLEHHESSDNGVIERGFVDEGARKPAAFLLPHEYTHSWCGKFRRPAGLITHDFQQAQKTKLLWVYEGLTEYLGTLLTARSGLWSPEETRDYLAMTAEGMQNQRGRTWRPLEDTTVGAPLNFLMPDSWASWRRTVDYYDEGVLIWLEVDGKIRQLTKGEKSLDDFCKRFFGGEGGTPALKPYTLDDVVADLNAVAPYDWRSLLNRRLQTTAEQAPLDGFEATGWKLSFKDKPSELFKLTSTARKGVNHASSIGCIWEVKGRCSTWLRAKPLSAPAWRPA
jgi:predicted metalloprotease with PDZ domain